MGTSRHFAVARWLRRRYRDALATALSVFSPMSRRRASGISEQRNLVRVPQRSTLQHCGASMILIFLPTWASAWRQNVEGLIAQASSVTPVAIRLATNLASCRKAPVHWPLAAPPAAAAIFLRSLTPPGREDHHERHQYHCTVAIVTHPQMTLQM